MTKFMSSKQSILSHKSSINPFIIVIINCEKFQLRCVIDVVQKSPTINKYTASQREFYSISCDLQKRSDLFSYQDVVAYQYYHNIIYLFIMEASSSIQTIMAIGWAACLAIDWKWNCNNESAP